MVALGTSDSFDDLQLLVAQIYGRSSDRWFDLTDMAINVSRFTMRAIKAVRYGRLEVIEKNLAVALSWFTSCANRLDLNLSEITWRRFPYRCATCKYCPCHCTSSAVPTDMPKATRPMSIADVQRMFGAIYPPCDRSLEHAAIHLVEELGEYQEAILMYRTRHRGVDLRQVEVEAADYLSCLFGVYNSIEHLQPDRGQVALALADFFAHNCHACRKAPCDCTFDRAMSYRLDQK